MKVKTKIDLTRRALLSATFEMMANEPDRVYKAIAKKNAIIMKTDVDYVQGMITYHLVGGKLPKMMEGSHAVTLNIT